MRGAHTRGVARGVAAAALQRDGLVEANTGLRDYLLHGAPEPWLAEGSAADADVPSSTRATPKAGRSPARERGRELAQVGELGPGIAIMGRPRDSHDRRTTSEDGRGEGGGVEARGGPAEARRSGDARDSLRSRDSAGEPLNLQPFTGALQPFSRDSAGEPTPRQRPQEGDRLEARRSTGREGAAPLGRSAVQGASPHRPSSHGTEPHTLPPALSTGNERPPQRPDAPAERERTREREASFVSWAKRPRDDEPSATAAAEAKRLRSESRSEARSLSRGRDGAAGRKAQAGPDAGEGPSPPAGWMARLDCALQRWTREAYRALERRALPLAELQRRVPLPGYLRGCLRLEDVVKNRDRCGVSAMQEGVSAMHEGMKA